MFDNIRMAKDAIEVLRDIKKRDWAELSGDLCNLLTVLGFAEDGERAKIFIDSLRNHEFKTALNELLFEAIAVMDVLTQDRPAMSQGILRKRPSEELELAQKDPQGWYAANKQAIQEGMQRPLGRWLLHRHPEIFTDEDKVFLDHLEGGTLFSATLSGQLDMAKVIKFIDKILPFVQIAAMIIPYVLPVYIVLKLISLCYHYRHPDGPKVGLAFDEL